jgi:hypothetical protein
MKQETRHAVRIALALLLALAVIVPATTASATGPGGWNHLGNGSDLNNLDGTPYVLNADMPGVLLAGGSFLNASGKPAADYLAKWNGSSWSQVATPALNGAVHAIAVDGSDIYVGGVFTDAGGNPTVDYLAKWDGAAWSSPCTGAPGQPALAANVEGVEIIGTNLYVGGAFQNGGGIASADYVLRCELTTGQAYSTVTDPTGAFSGGISAMDTDINGKLYVGGGFSNLENVSSADNVAYFNTTSGTWNALGSGPTLSQGAVTSFVRTLTVQGTDAYIGTDANDIAGLTNADHVAKWNGSTWSALGANTAGTNGWFTDANNTYLYGMETSGQFLFVTGQFQNANGNPRADYVAYFDGTTWRNLGSNGQGNGPWIGTGEALSMWQGRLIAAGNFNDAGGDLRADRVASFDLLRPDAKIALNSGGPYAGSNVYSATAGSRQTKIVTVQRGNSKTFVLRFENDGLSADSFKIQGTGSGNGYSVKYFKGSSDVTNAVRNGTFSTGPLDPGEFVTLKLVVKLANNTATSGAFLTKAKSGPATEHDGVKAVVKAT